MIYNFSEMINMNFLKVFTENSGQKYTIFFFGFTVIEIMCNTLKYNHILDRISFINPTDC